MSKGKLYKINVNNNSNYVNDRNGEILQFIVGIVVYAVVLVIASVLFRGIYIENFWYALVAALILNILNSTIKPLLIFWTLPLTVSTLGLCYPIVNMIILWLCSLVMGSSFIVTGIFNLFFISIFISGLRLFLYSMITSKIRRK